MKIIKFLGKLVAAPIDTCMFILTIGLLPIKLLSSWLRGNWDYTRSKFGAFKTFLKKGIAAIKRGEKPTIGRVLTYGDDKENVYFFYMLIHNVSLRFVLVRCIAPRCI